MEAARDPPDYFPKKSAAETDEEHRERWAYCMKMTREIAPQQEEERGGSGVQGPSTPLAEGGPAAAGAPGGSGPRTG